MIKDVLISIFSSVFASFITGFLGNKAIGKNSSLTLKIYVLFLAASALIITSILSIVLNEDLAEKISQISETNLLRFYDNCIRTIVIVFIIIACITIGILITEYLRKSDKEIHKQSMDRLKMIYSDKDEK